MPDGHATFEIDDETFDAPAGPFVSVRPESRRKATATGTVLAIGAKTARRTRAGLGARAWWFHSESTKAYGEQRYADALDAVRRA